MAINSVADRADGKGGVARSLLAALSIACLGAACVLLAQDRSFRPQLLVVLIIDQMRADYVDRYGTQWSNGLRRLFDRGAFFPQAAYPYFQTATCPGHATVSTGTFPAKHGMIANQWWDRASGRPLTCTYDPSAPLVSYGTPVSGGDSAASLRVPSLPEELHKQYGASSRAAVFSLKDRSAIGLAGRRADVVTWFHEPSGHWVTSEAYSDTPVAFVRDYLRRHPVEKGFKAWTRLGPARRYLYADDAVGERPPLGWTQTFPHPIAGNGRTDPTSQTRTVPSAGAYSLWAGSPRSDEYLAGLASAAVEALHLGRDSTPDFLGVSFSALDLVGHRFGPRSHEVQDVLARLDRTIGRLLDYLDGRVGRERYVVALTSDHGVSSIPEQLIAEGVVAGRIVVGDIRDRVEDVLDARFGAGSYVARVLSADLYFEPGIAARVNMDKQAQQAIVNAIATMPGVARVFMASEVTAHTEDPDAGPVALSYFPGRSGDVIIVPRPNWFLTVRETPSTPAVAASHGTGHEYDARVPLVLMGQGIRRGRYDPAVTPADIAPTLAALAGFTLHDRDGRVLVEAMTTVPTSKK